MRRFLMLIGISLTLLSSCKESLIYPAPGAAGRGTFLVGKPGVDASKWTAVFSHRTNGGWVSDTTVSMAERPILMVDQFHRPLFWPTAGAGVDTYRIQVWEGKTLLDEKILTTGHSR